MSKYNIDNLVNELKQKEDEILTNVGKENVDVYMFLMVRGKLKLMSSS